MLAGANVPKVPTLSSQRWALRTKLPSTSSDSKSPFATMTRGTKDVEVDVDVELLVDVEVLVLDMTVSVCVTEELEDVDVLEEVDVEEEELVV